MLFDHALDERHFSAKCMKELLHKFWCFADRASQYNLSN